MVTDRLTSKSLSPLNALREKQISSSQLLAAPEPDSELVADALDFSIVHLDLNELGASEFFAVEDLERGDFLFGFLGLWIEAAERALMGQGVEFIGLGVAGETAQGLFEDQPLDAFHELGIWQIGLPARGGHELE
jgi:hypothetical protein|tara:strand:- start:670 stop:1074 length:405 start_codon:yes stop_codon:yes gene_type:complete